MRTLALTVLTLALAAPASASTLDHMDETYRFQGTPERDVLIVSDDGASVTFTDGEGTLSVTGELPPGCETVAANSVRCTQIPQKKTLMDGGAGDDELVGSRFAEYMLGGDGNDRFRPGLGADYLDTGPGYDTLDFSRDARDAGVFVTQGSGPDSGDSFGGDFDRYIGTRHADSFILLDQLGVDEIETLGGRDYINTADSYRASSPGDRLECGRGVDLFLINYTDDEGVIGCEEAGNGLGEPSAGLLVAAYPARYLPRRRLVFTGTATCRAGGERCTLRIEVNGFGETVRHVRPGKGVPLTHVMSRRDYARAEAKGKAVRRIRFSLRKPGFPMAWAQFSRNISP